MIIAMHRIGSEPFREESGNDMSILSSKFTRCFREATIDLVVSFLKSVILSSDGKDLTCYCNIPYERQVGNDVHGVLQRPVAQ